LPADTRHGVDVAKLAIHTSDQLFKHCPHANDRVAKTSDPTDNGALASYFRAVTGPISYSSLPCREYARIKKGRNLVLPSV
jgi:hypothetical protein